MAVYIIRSTVESKSQKACFRGDDIIQLGKKISRLYGRDFSEQNPVVTVKDNGLMFAAYK